MLAVAVTGTRYSVVASPIGDLILHGSGDAIVALQFADGRNSSPADGAVRDDNALRDAREQLSAYFAGELTRFDLKLLPGGTPFQTRVWAALQNIPFGETTTYGQLAKELGVPRAMRAVGHANGRNPIAIVIPCHRLIGADGGLTGYGGGLHRKQWLLTHERTSA